MKYGGDQALTTPYVCYSQFLSLEFVHSLEPPTTHWFLRTVQGRWWRRGWSALTAAAIMETAPAPSPPLVRFVLSVSWQAMYLEDLVEP